MLNKQRKMTWRTYLAYGAADLYGGGCFFIVTTFSMYYLVNVVGLHPVLAGLIPAIGKFWDAISDPMMGYIADNTPQNRFGKRRVWFLVSIVPIALSFIIIWFPAGIESQAGKFIFYTVAYIIFFTVSTVSYIPYAALSAEITKDFSERNKLNGSRLMFSFIATLLGGLLAQPIIDAFHGSMMGYFVMSIVFALIFALPWIPLYFETWELPEEKPQKKSEAKFIKNFLSLFKSKSCRIHIAMYVCSYGALDIVMSLVLFYIVDYLNRGSVFVIAQGALLLTMMAALPIHNRIINKRGHKPVYVTALIIFAVSVIFMALHTPETPAVFLILNMVFMGVGISANNLIPHQLLPFLADIDKLMSGENRAGTYSAAMTLTRKLFLGLVIMTTIGFVLSGIGYKNPVPSVLTQKQFKEAEALALKNSENFENINKYYSLLEDGNFHLKYMSRNTDEIITSVYKKAKKNNEKNLSSFFEGRKNFDAIPQDMFENFLLSSFDKKDFDSIDEKFLVKSSYIKSGAVYKKIEPQDFYTKADLYDLKVLLDKINFKYSGIGQVQKPQQKDSTLKGVKISFIIMPLFMILFGIFFGLKFNVSPENHKIILAELNRLEDGGKKEDADEKTKQVCELLIGEPYGRI
ncbi:MFS transporter [Treponema sp. OMZ 788]|uniref:MFS transporter n=1 Tax=unclassified Treponema TaxID=2638727 RepID=UPI0020A3A16B|nr:MULTISPECIES: MFS transporter [unclassified Treponema]UTC62269.1 MFS transporter [Treponema sp. OMZ 787]UTC64756.1 MFS transporter [Treponema sp. OMZ 788]